jgi:glutamate--cysteine ligase
VLAEQSAAIDDPDRTPSARILAEMRKNGESFYAFARRMSERHRDHFLNRELAPETQARFQQMAQQSLAAQARIEAADTLSFDAFLKQYFSQR